MVGVQGRGFVLLVLLAFWVWVFWLKGLYAIYNVGLRV